MGQVSSLFHRTYQIRSDQIPVHIGHIRSPFHRTGHITCDRSDPCFIGHIRSGQIRSDSCFIGHIRSYHITSYHIRYLFHRTYQIRSDRIRSDQIGRIRSLHASGRSDPPFMIYCGYSIRIYLRFRPSAQSFTVDQFFLRWDLHGTARAQLVCQVELYDASLV